MYLLVAPNFVLIFMDFLAGALACNVAIQNLKMITILQIDDPGSSKSEIPFFTILRIVSLHVAH